MRWVALAVLMLPVLLVAIDNTVLSFAVPSISEALRPTGEQLLWIVDIYPLVLAGLLVPMGSLGDRFGRRRMLMIGSTGFVVISAVAAFVPSAEALIAARAAMGFFGAMLMPATLSLIRNIFTDQNERRTAIAIWAAGFSGGAALGPIVGQPMITDGIASAISGSVTTQGCSCGACERWPLGSSSPSWPCACDSCASTTKRSLPWKVM